jgi:hypothetical protein
VGFTENAQLAPSSCLTLYCMCVGACSHVCACACLRVFAHICACLRARARVCARARERRHAQHTPHTHAQRHAQHCNAQTCGDMRNDALHFDCARERGHARHILRSDARTRNIAMSTALCGLLCVFARVCVYLRECDGRANSTKKQKTIQ